MALITNIKNINTSIKDISVNIDKYTKSSIILALYGKEDNLVHNDLLEAYDECFSIDGNSLTIEYKRKYDKFLQYFPYFVPRLITDTLRIKQINFKNYDDLEYIIINSAYITETDNIFSRDFTLNSEIPVHFCFNFYNNPKFKPGGTYNFNNTIFCTHPNGINWTMGGLKHTEKIKQYNELFNNTSYKLHVGLGLGVEYCIINGIGKFTDKLESRPNNDFDIAIPEGMLICLFTNSKAEWDAGFIRVPSNIPPKQVYKYAKERLNQSTYFNQIHISKNNKYIVLF